MDKKTKRVYFVQTIDMWENVYFHGVYDSLAKASEDVRAEYAYVAGIEDFELVEYASTFSWVFDKELYDEDSGEWIRTFGYIFTIDAEDTHLKLDIEKED